jgi:hypothetical protein
MNAARTGSKGELHAIYVKLVGWVKAKRNQSDVAEPRMGFAALNPSYALHHAAGDRPTALAGTGSITAAIMRQLTPLGRR